VATESSSTQSTTVSSNNLPITQAEFYMLANLVAHEYGADWVSLHEKAKVVATVMNRVRMSKFPNTVREVILQKNQYCWVPDSYYWKRTTQSCKDAVTYYFQHTNEFSSKITSFYGDGWVNHFY
jgi:spore germination cell wall hydrolase CwlJ-like protein